MASSSRRRRSSVAWWVAWKWCWYCPSVCSALFVGLLVDLEVFRQAHLVQRGLGRPLLVLVLVRGRISPVTKDAVDCLTKSLIVVVDHVGHRAGLVGVHVQRGKFVLLLLLLREGIQASASSRAAAHLSKVGFLGSISCASRKFSVRYWMPAWFQWNGRWAGRGNCLSQVVDRLLALEALLARRGSTAILTPMSPPRTPG